MATVTTPEPFYVAVWARVAVGSWFSIARVIETFQDHNGSERLTDEALRSFGWCGNISGILEVPVKKGRGNVWTAQTKFGPIDLSFFGTDSGLVAAILIGGVWKQLAGAEIEEIVAEEARRIGATVASLEASKNDDSTGSITSISHGSTQQEGNQIVKGGNGANSGANPQDVELSVAEVENTKVVLSRKLMTTDADLADVQDHLFRLEDELAVIRRQEGALKMEESCLLAEVDALSQKSHAIATKIKDLDLALKDEVDPDSRAERETMKLVLEAQNERICSVISEVNAQTEAIVHRGKQMNNKSRQLEDELDELKAHLAELEKSRASLQTLIAELPHLPHATKSAPSASNGRVAPQSLSAAPLKPESKQESNISHSSPSIDSKRLVNQISDMEEEIHWISDQLEDMDSSIAQLSRRREDVVSDLDELERLSSRSDDRDKATADAAIAQMMASLGNLEAKLADLAKARGSVNSKLRESKAIQEELKSQLDKLSLDQHDSNPSNETEVAHAEDIARYEEAKRREEEERRVEEDDKRLREEEMRQELRVVAELKMLEAELAERERRLQHEVNAQRSERMAAEQSRMEAETRARNEAMIWAKMRMEEEMALVRALEEQRRLESERR